MTFNRSSGGIRTRLVQLRPEKGRVSENLARIRSHIGQAAAQEVDLVVFPECALSGYFVEGAVEELARSPREVAAALGDPPKGAPDVVLGMYERGGEGVYNSAVYLTPDADGWTILHVHRKVFLPTYGVFQEGRFVVPGRAMKAVSTRFGRIGLLICEEMLHSVCPTVLALDDAELMICVAATPVRDFVPGSGLPGNLERWDVAGRSIALEHGVHLLVGHLVGSEGGKMFAGGSVAYAPDGRIMTRGALFEEDQVDVLVDRSRVLRQRVASPLLSDLRVMLPHLLPGLEPSISRPASAAPGEDASAGRVTDREPSSDGALPDPDDGSMLDLDMELVERALVRFLQEEVRERRGFQRLVVGVSGGVDSAVSTYLAARALGPENVQALLLPYATSSPESLELGRLVVEETGVAHRMIPVTSGVDAYVEAEEPDIPDIRRGNLAARYRALVLWDQSARLGALPLGTGNKSERLLGYYTWHADDAPPINPLGDLFKTQVLALARHLGVPSAVIERPPSPDLVEGVHDEDELGVRYEVADRILHWLLEGISGARLVDAGFPADEVEQVQKRLEGTHWKRRLPTVAMLSSTAIGEFYLRPVDL